MDKIKATEVDGVFTDDNLPEEMVAKLKEVFPNAVFKRASEATGDEAAQMNPASPTPDEPPQLFDFLRKFLIQCDATTHGCEHHKSVVKDEPAPTPSQEEVVRRVAYGKLMQVAEEYGLRFNQQELAALFMLSVAADPQVAINTAHDMCRRFVGAWGV